MCYSILLFVKQFSTPSVLGIQTFDYITTLKLSIPQLFLNSPAVFLDTTLIFNQKTTSTYVRYFLEVDHRTRRSHLSEERSYFGGANVFRRRCDLGGETGARKTGAVDVGFVYSERSVISMSQRPEVVCGI